MTDAALLVLIENYYEEVGLQNLQKHLEIIYHKVCSTIHFYILITKWGNFIIVRLPLRDDGL